jgi:uncharacterized hydantoinase/oxoprolinase family protein
MLFAIHNWTANYVITALSECDHLLDCGSETNGIMPFAAGVVRNRLDSARLKSRQIR